MKPCDYKDENYMERPVLPLYHNLHEHFFVLLKWKEEMDLYCNWLEMIIQLQDERIYNLQRDKP